MLERRTSGFHPLAIPCSPVLPRLFKVRLSGFLIEINAAF